MSCGPASLPSHLRHTLPESVQRWKLPVSRSRRVPLLAAQRRLLVAHSADLPAPLANSLQRSAESVLGGLAFDDPSPLPGASPVVGEPQHHEALALRTSPPTSMGCKTPPSASCPGADFSSRLTSSCSARSSASDLARPRSRGFTSCSNPGPDSVDVRRDSPLWGPPLRIATRSLRRSTTSLLLVVSLRHPSVQKAPQVTPIHASEEVLDVQVYPATSELHHKALQRGYAPAESGEGSTPAPTPSAPRAGGSSSVGMNRARLVPGFSRCTRRTAGARYRPDLNRSSNSVRFASRSTSYCAAVTPSTPAAASLRIRR